MSAEMIRSGDYWLLKDGNRIIYKSKDKAKVLSRLEGRRRCESNAEMRRESMRFTRWW